MEVEWGELRVVDSLGKDIIQGTDTSATICDYENTF